MVSLPPRMNHFFPSLSSLKVSHLSPHCDHHYVYVFSSFSCASFSSSYFSCVSFVLCLHHSTLHFHHSHFLRLYFSVPPKYHDQILEKTSKHILKLYLYRAEQFIQYFIGVFNRLAIFQSIFYT